MTRMIVRRMVRWGVVAVVAHSTVLILIAPSAFMYYGEGFILTRPQAQIALRILDGAIEGVVYHIANYRIPPGVYWWLAERLPSLDEASLVAATVLHLLVGGVFYFVIGASLACLVSVPGLWRRRSAA